MVNRDQLIAYLLHQMAEDEREAFSERCFLEPGLREDLQMAEADLLDAYARGRPKVTSPSSLNAGFWALQSAAEARFRSSPGHGTSRRGAHRRVSQGACWAATPAEPEFYLWQVLHHHYGWKGSPAPAPIIFPHPYRWRFRSPGWLKAMGGSSVANNIVPLVPHISQSPLD